MPGSVQPERGPLSKQQPDTPAPPVLVGGVRVTTICPLLLVLTATVGGPGGNILQWCIQSRKAGNRAGGWVHTQGPASAQAVSALQTSVSLCELRLPCTALLQGPSPCAWPPTPAWQPT